MRTSTKSVSKRMQHDYTLDFKLAIVAQVQKGVMSYKQAQREYGIQGRSSVLVWLRKHGKLDWSNPYANSLMSKAKETPTQKVKRLERTLSEATAKNEIMGKSQSGQIMNAGVIIKKKHYQSLWQGKSKRKLTSACRSF